jgi:hypothetical protein
MAVKDRLRNNPLDCPLPIIRLWGVLVGYKPNLQRRWSKALVRHGVDARSAIVGVLGLPAGDIQLREGSG